MRRSGLALAALLAAGSVLGWLFLSSREAPATPAPTEQPAKATDAEAGIRAATADYVKAFNAADAKASAALWTEAGEYVGPEGEVVSGRANIEKSLADHFKEMPGATIEVRIESVKPMGRGLATVIGVVTIKYGDEPPGESRYTALHVLEDGKWLAASVREVVPDPASEVTPQQLEWLVGEWTAQGPSGEVRIVYSWDDAKAFLAGKYTVTKNGKAVSSGTQVIGRNPTGGLRSWLFDSTGTTSDGLWIHDDGRWVSESSGILPDGTELTSVNVLVRIDDDSFTWQTTEREANGVSLPQLPPVKVTRVKK